MPKDTAFTHAHTPLTGLEQQILVCVSTSPLSTHMTSFHNDLIMCSTLVLFQVVKATVRQASLCSL